MYTEPYEPQTSKYHAILKINANVISNFVKYLFAEKRLSQRGKLVSPKGSYFVGELTRYGGIEDDHIPFLRKG